MTRAQADILEAFIFDIGVFDIDLVVGKVDFELVLDVLPGLTFDPQAGGSEFCLGRILAVDRAFV